MRIKSRPPLFINVLPDRIPKLAKYSFGCSKSKVSLTVLKGSMLSICLKLIENIEKPFASMKFMTTSLIYLAISGNNTSICIILTIVQTVWNVVLLILELAIVNVTLAPVKVCDIMVAVVVLQSGPQDGVVEEVLLVEVLLVRDISQDKESTLRS